MPENEGIRNYENIKIPKHIAIIMDGNGRWAEKKGLPRIAGHRYGISVIKETVNICKKKGVKILTVFAFSSENWSRSITEISNIMYLLLSILKNEILYFKDNRIRVKILGDTKNLSKEIRRQIVITENLTENNKDFFLNIAINYGGKWDILEACKKIVEDILNKKIKINDIDEKLFQFKLSLGKFSEPDLFIRTGGEKRNSNFILWELAYTEYYFTNVMWPDFKQEDLEKAILIFEKRKRKYGYIKK